MRLLGLIFTFSILTVGCKPPSGQVGSGAKGQSAGSVADLDDDVDDGAIDIPKELHAEKPLKAKARASLALAQGAGEEQAQTLKAGDRVEVKIRYGQKLKLKLKSDAMADDIRLLLEGSSLDHVTFTGPESTLSIDFAGDAQERLAILIPEDFEGDLVLTEIRALGGENFEWKILSP